MTDAVQEKQYDVADMGLAEKGRFRMQWAAKEMPVLDLLEERFRKEQPFKGIRIGAAMHVTSETANLMRILLGGRCGGGSVRQQPAEHAGRHRRGPGGLL